ncbi:ribosome maturation factor RimM [Silvibacterium dinghuense]|uniref:Ribosome maturation factor RimM n=1 Tax=Silvibacterium dinghuense TaxID=1560006 RepID=A0A4Q1SI15_9BACT|nr:16S rRNA processing protein RimM [Silvibacterium dinghuense]
MSGWALLAHLVRPQGRHGEILADILTDFPERFSDRRRLFLLPPGAEATPTAKNQAPPREIELEDFWLHQGRIVLKFAGVDSIDDAEKFRGFHVAIPESERAELTDGSVYISDLEGCTVIDLATEGAPAIGTVVEVDRSASLLVLKGTDGSEVLVPFAKAYLETIDIAAKRIEMRLPAGLLEINAPLTAEERKLQQAAAAEEGAPSPTAPKKWTKHRPWKKKPQK